MINERREAQNEMEVVMLEQLVPQDHLLRKIDKYIDFSFIRDLTRDLYCHTNGRPAVDPVVLFKMLFIGYLYGIRSERQLVKDIEVNLAYRWFLGYSITEKIPDASTISQNRIRRFKGTDIPQKIFDNIVIQAIEKGLVGGKILYSDSTHIKANANKRKFEKVTFYTSDLNEMLLVDINYSFKTGASYSKFKVYLILNNIKYALPFNYFEDIYRNCMDILAKEVNDNEEINYIKESFNNLKKEEISVDINLNLERLKEFKDKVDFKRNVRYFVINNIASSISKYDIKNKTNKIKVTDKVKVLRHNYKTRLYEFINPTDNTNMVSLKETDIICDLGDENTFPTVNIYTSYGLGKLLDIKNNVVPSTNTLSLFANLLDLGLNVLN